MYETGENKWRTFDQWPPKGVTPRSLYLHANGGLSFTAPTEPTAKDSYVSDPSKPVPYTQAMSFGYFRGYPAEDQRFASARPDVLVYETPPLESDLTLAGQIGVSLKIASSGTDADFIVKVVDVYPNDVPATPDVPAAVATLTGERLAGYEQLVKGDVFRARWRDSYSAPKPLVPGTAGVDQLSTAGRLSHVQEGTSVDGAGAEHVVPAHRPQSADVRGEHQHGERVRLQAGDDAGVPVEGLGHASHAAGAAAVGDRAVVARLAIRDATVTVWSWDDVR